jgi:hypothetical protein
MKEPTWGVKVKAGYGREGNSKGISEERDKFIFWGVGVEGWGWGGEGALGPRLEEIGFGVLRLTPNPPIPTPRNKRQHTNQSPRFKHSEPDFL